MKPSFEIDPACNLASLPCHKPSFIVMGPGSTLPSRPKFSWDIRSVPWTDGKGDQAQYASSVSLWKSFHDRLPANNPSKIPADLQGIMLQSQLYGRALDVCKKIPNDTIQSADGVKEIVQAVYKRDPLAAVSDVYQDFLEVMNAKRGHNESFKNFEARFEAQVAKFNAHADSSKLPEALVAFMLLANSNVDSGQRISVLAAAAPRDQTFGEDATAADFLKSVSYGSVASVLRQCDKPRASSSEDVRPLHSNTANTSSMRPPSKPRRKNRLTPELGP